MAKLTTTILCLLLCVMLLPVAALAEDCFLIDVDSLDMNSLTNNDYIAANLTAQTEGIRVRKYISDSNELAAPARLTVTQVETDTIVFDKNYGYVSGTFDSGDIYLPYVDNNTIPYLITLNIGDWTYAMPFMHQQPRLTHNSACTFGVRLRDYNPAITDHWIMGTMIDLNALRAQGQTIVPLCASNLYIVGQATLAMNGDELTVYLDFDASANVTVDQCAVYLVGDVNSLTSDNPSAINLPAYGVGQAIDTSGLTTALLYLPISLSYDPSNVSGFSYDLSSPDLSQQLSLWNQNAQGTAGAQDSFQPDPTPETDPQEALPTDDGTFALPDAGDGEAVNP